MKSCLASCVRLFGCLLTSALLCQQVAAQPVPELAGYWVLNEKLSDSTDKKVEAALKADGQKAKRKWFSRDKEQFRGGPEEQELYDRISYDRELNIQLEGDAYLFTYADDWQRQIYTDNRSRSVSLAALDEVKDFSFAHWEGTSLLVEARPRDGGFADETYTLINGGSQLQAKFYIKPGGFRSAVELTRIFDRKARL